MRKAHLLMAALVLAAAAGTAFARLDIERYRALREAERYQIDVADKLEQKRAWKDALAEYEKFINLYVDSAAAPYAQYMISLCDENLNQVNVAVKEYKAVLTYFPDSPEAPLAAFALGRCYGRSGEMEMAAQQYLQTATRYREHAIAGNALWEASGIYLNRDLYEKAVELRRTLVDAYPKSERFPDAVDWLVDHYLFRAGDVSAARAVNRLRRSPVEAECHMAQRCYDRAWRLYQREGKKEEGTKGFDQAVALMQGVVQQFPGDKPRVLEALGLIAQSYRYSDRPDAATTAFERLMKEFPDQDNWREHYARSLEERGQWPQARLEFTRFQDKARGAFQAAESWHRQRKVAEAEEAYLRVIQEYPAQAKISLYRIGDLHRHVSHDYEKAINAYRQSEYSPPQHLFRIGESFSAMKNYTMAIQTYQEIIGFFESSAPEALWRIGLCYEDRKEPKDVENAIASFKRICDLYPGSGASSNAHQRLESKYKIPYTGGGIKKE